MTTRPDALAHVHEVACGVLDTTHCYPVVQPTVQEQGQDVFQLPAVVYYAVGQQSVTPLAGPHVAATAVRYEVRSRSYQGAGGAATLDRALVSALRQAGRLTGLLSLVDEYDDERGIYRRIRSVMVRR
ncbi:MAG: hypothetical protein F4156_09850 [Holophagales bacterium]|nr:hypothetical protein [Holophagales bacterium]